MIQETKRCPECYRSDTAPDGEYRRVKPFCGTCGWQIHRIKISSEDIYEVHPTWDFSTTNGIYDEVDRIESERPEWSRDVRIFALSIDDEDCTPERIMFSAKKGVCIDVRFYESEPVFFVRDYGHTTIFSSMDILLLYYELDDNCKKDSEEKK